MLPWPGTEYLQIIGYMCRVKFEIRVGPDTPRQRRILIMFALCPEMLNYIGRFMTVKEKLVSQCCSAQSCEVFRADGMWEDCSLATSRTLLDMRGSLHRFKTLTPRILASYPADARNTNAATPMLYYAVRDNNFDFAIATIVRYNITKADVLASGMFAVWRSIIHEGRYDRSDYADSRSLPALQWLTSTFDITTAELTHGTSRREKLMRVACIVGGLDVAMWLAELGLHVPRFEDTLKRANRYGHTKVAEWLEANRATLSRPWVRRR